MFVYLNVYDFLTFLSRHTTSIDDACSTYHFSQALAPSSLRQLDPQSDTTLTRVILEVSSLSTRTLKSGM